MLTAGQTGGPAARERCPAGRPCCGCSCPATARVGPLRSPRAPCPWPGHVLNVPEGDRSWPCGPPCRCRRCPGARSWSSGAIAVLLVLFTAIGTLTNVYVDYLWFAETHFTEVFWTELQTRVAAVRGRRRSASAGSSALADLPGLPVPAHVPADVAGAAEPRALPAVAGAAPHAGAHRGRRGPRPVRRLHRAGQLADLAARSATAPTSARKDPQFGLDLSFFVFDYPFYRLVLGFAFATVLLALIGSLLTHYVFGGLRLQTPGQKLTSAARVQISVLLGMFVALKAVAYWLDRYGLVYSDRGEVFTGASYTDVNALLVPKTILVFVAVVCAMAFFANIVFRNFLLPAAALVLLLLSSLVIGVAYPAIVQQFVVKPSAEPEGGALHQAGDLLDAGRLRPVRRRVRRTTPQDTTGNTVDTGGGAGRPAQRQRRRSPTPGCWTRTCCRRRSPRASRSATSTASRRSSTSTATPIDGKARDYVVAARELDSAGLSGNQANWINRHTVYTHGNGFVAAPANEVVAGQEGGEPNFTTGNLPTTGNIPVKQAAHLLRRADHRLLRRRRAQGRHRPASSTSPRTARATGRSATPTTARAASRSAASSGS